MIFSWVHRLLSNPCVGFDFRIAMRVKRDLRSYVEAQLTNGIATSEVRHRSRLTGAGDALSYSRRENNLQFLTFYYTSSMLSDERSAKIVLFFFIFTCMLSTPAQFLKINQH